MISIRAAIKRDFTNERIKEIFNAAKLPKSRYVLNTKGIEYFREQTIIFVEISCTNPSPIDNLRAFKKALAICHKYEKLRRKNLDLRVLVPRLPSDFITEFTKKLETISDLSTSSQGGGPTRILWREELFVFTMSFFKAYFNEEPTANFADEECPVTEECISNCSPYMKFFITYILTMHDWLLETRKQEAWVNDHVMKFWKFRSLGSMRKRFNKVQKIPTIFSDQGELLYVVDAKDILSEIRSKSC
ncbi:MAG: hypothetical protein COA43_05925 [Robiginitomaculum sp.]|nr:MAG: hypothetical protein COA43_05925 [Robiginitomaculum sp.]